MSIMLKNRTRRGRMARRGYALLAALALVAPLGGCDLEKLLEADAPGRLPAERLEDPQYASLLVNGAVADLECAIGAFVLVGAIITDEFADAQNGSAAWPYDRRDAGRFTNGAYGVNGCAENQTPGVYRPLSTARWAADNALRNLEAWSDKQVPNREALISKAALYSGFSHAMLGMAMCSAAVDGGPELSSQQLFALAEERFDRAIEAGLAAQQMDFVNAARVGRARVRLYQGDETGAAADAAAVPPDFVYNATASADNNRRYNRIFAANPRYRFFTVDPQSRDIRTGGVPDPRARAVYNGQNAVDGTPLWEQTKYTDYGSPIPLARGAEAQLILAEIRGGQEAVQIINQLRDRHGLPHFTSSDPAEIEREVIEERRKELWLEGHRMYDFRRFDLPLVPAPGTPFVRGGVYGDTRCLPLPDVERQNNPNIN